MSVPRWRAFLPKGKRQRDIFTISRLFSKIKNDFQYPQTVRVTVHRTRSTNQFQGMHTAFLKIHPTKKGSCTMTTYATTPLYEIEELIQGARVAGLHEEDGALFVELEAWEDKNGVIQCDTLAVLPYIDEDGRAQLRVDFIENPEPENGNNGAVGE